MSDIIDRRLFLASLGAVAATGWIGPAAASQQVAGFHMWHVSGCGCCLEWGRQVEAAFGRKLKVIESPHMAMVKRANGVPADLQSCHTALIGTAIVEGHVPPADIRRFIAGKSRVATGLAVPGMPIGSPGMEVPGRPAQPYQVFAFNDKGQRFVFARHG
jgi:hypothetical protein